MPISHASSTPVITRVRHELAVRTLDVLAVTRLTPHMIRVTLGGAELEGFASAAPDDHIKIMVPDQDGTIVRRDYTPRHYDRETGTLLLDFVDHEGGPAAAWARSIVPGGTLQIGGPRGSQVIGGEIRHWLLIGDETALPAIGRRVEELPAHTTVTTLVAVPGPEDEQVFATAAQHTAHWVHRPVAQADQAEGLLAALEKIVIPEGTFVWVGAEASVAKAVRHVVQEQRQHPVAWLKASGYWLKGQADASVKDIGPQS